MYFLVPFYTSILSATEYGIYDMFNVAISLLLPILILNIPVAVLRFSLDEHSDRDSIFSYGFFVFLRGFSILFCLVGLNNIFGLIPVLRQFSIEFLLLFFATGFHQLLTSFARGNDDVFAVTVSSIVQTLILAVLNIVLLKYLQMGLKGFFYAYIFGSGISAIYLCIRLRIWNFLSILKIKRNNINREMITYSIARDFSEANGIKIFNATRGGKLEVFERVDIDALLESAT